MATATFNAKSLPKKEVSLLEVILENVGLGPWNYLIFAAASITVMIPAVTLVSSEFTAPKLKFQCADPLYNDDVSYINGTQCQVMDHLTSTVRPCQNIIFDNSTFSNSVTSQFELVCDRANLLVLYQVMVSLGCVCGALLGGVISERFGRARVFYIFILIMCMCVALNIFSPVYEGILIARFILGFTSVVAMNVIFTLGMEVCPARLRSFFGINFAIPYALMIGFMGVAGWAMRDWQILNATLYFPLYLMIIFGHPWVIDESPRWLVSKNRLKDAERVIRRGSRLNGTTEKLPDNLTELLENIYEREGSHDQTSLSLRIRSLFTTPEMRRLAFLQGSLWFSFGIVYIYIPLSVDMFSSPFWGMVLLGVAEIPAYTVTAPLTQRVGRRLVIGGSLALGAFFALLNLALNFANLDGGWTKTIIASIAFMFYCSAWQVGQTHRAEVFPTSVRSVASSITYGMANIGNGIPPFVDMIMDRVGPGYESAPVVAYSVIAVIGVFLVYQMPETNGVPLKQTVHEYVQDLHRDQLARYVEKINGIYHKEGIVMSRVGSTLAGGAQDTMRRMTQLSLKFGTQLSLAKDEAAKHSQSSLAPQRTRHSFLSEPLGTDCDYGIETRNFSQDMFSRQSSIFSVKPNH